MFHGIRWVLFDAVGTLIYPDPPVADAYHAAGKQYGSALTRKECQQRFNAALTAEHQPNGESEILERPETNESLERERWKRIVNRVLDDVHDPRDEPFEELWRHFAQPSSWKLYSDVEHTLVALRSRDFQLGVASNFDNRLKAIMAAHASLATMQAVFTSSELGYSKPDSRFFHAVARQLNVSPHEIVLVGDDEVSDVRGATAAGWRAIRLLRGKADMPAGGITSLSQLIE